MKTYKNTKKKAKNRINKWLQLMLEETPHQTKLSKLF